MRREQKWMCDGCDKKYVACEPPACTVENFAPDDIPTRNLRYCTKPCARTDLLRRLDQPIEAREQGKEIRGGFTTLLPGQTYWLREDLGGALVEKQPDAGATALRCRALSKTEILIEG